MNRRDSVMLDAARALAHALSNAALIAEINGSVQVKAPLLRAHGLARLLVAGLGGAVKPRTLSLEAWASEWRELVVEPHKGTWPVPTLSFDPVLAGETFVEIPGSLTLSAQDLSAQGPLMVTVKPGMKVELGCAEGCDFSFVEALCLKNGWRLVKGPRALIELR